MSITCESWDLQSPLGALKHPRVSPWRAWWTVNTVFHWVLLKASFSWHSNSPSSGTAFPLQPRAKGLGVRSCLLWQPKDKPAWPAISHMRDAGFQVQEKFQAQMARNTAPSSNQTSSCVEGELMKCKAETSTVINRLGENGVSYFLCRWLHFQHQLRLPLINPDCTES